MGLSIARNLGWLVGIVGRLVRLRTKEPPIFDVAWRFYDCQPAEGNAVGTARFRRVWWYQSVQGRWLRTKERSTRADANHLYGGRGFLRDRKLVLNWASEERPDTFGVLFLTIDEDCQGMKGFTVLAPQDTGAAEAKPIWFRRTGASP